MSAKQRAKARIKQRLTEKLQNLTAQEDALCSLIHIHVDKVRRRTNDVLGVEDTDLFLQQYAVLEQQLDKVFSTCELLTATAEDMIESQDMHDSLCGKEESTLLAGETTSTAQGHLENETSFAQEPRSSTPILKPADSVIKEEKKETPQKSEPKREKSDNGHKPTEDYIKAKSKECFESGQDTSSSEEKSQSESHSKTNQTSDPCNERKREEVLKTKVIDLPDLRKPDLSSTPKVPSSVKKQVEHYGQGYQVSEVSDEESFNKRLEEGRKDKKSSPKKKQKSPKKKKSKAEKVASADSVKQRPESSTVADDGKTETNKSSDCTELSDDSKVQGHDKKQVDNERRDNITENTNIKTDKDTKTTAKSVPKSSEIRDKTRAYVIPEDEDFSDNKLVCSGVSASSLSESQMMLQPLGFYRGELLSQEVTPVIVSEVISPWCFFVQPNGSQLKQLMGDICLYMTTKGMMEPHLHNPHFGTLCLAQFSNDKSFYRASIFRVHNSVSGTVSYVDVLYLDYGNKEKVKVTDLRTLPEKFQVLPPQAACCALAEVMPINKYCVWTEEDILTFKHYVSNQQLSCIRTCSSSVPTLPHLVKLVGNYPIPSMVPSQFVLQPVCIGQFLVNRGSARHMEVTEQIKHLIKTEEGKEESTILNTTMSTRHSPRIREIFPKNSMESPNSGNLAKESGSKRDITKDFQENKTPDVNVTDNKELNIDARADLSESAKTEAEAQQPDNQKLQSSEKECKHLSQLESNPEKETHRIDTSASANSRNHKRKETENPARESKPAEGTEKEIGNSISQDSLDSWPADSVTTDTEKDQSSLSMPLTYQSNLDLSENSQGQEIMLAHIKSPGHFYVHIISREVGSTLDRLMKNLNRGFEQMNRRKLANLSRTFEPAVNVICCAQFTQDNNFYRARIKLIPNVPKASSNTKEGKVFVHYIDFGDEEWVSRKTVYPLPQQYANIPPLATCCNLAFIQPRGGKDNSGSEWTASSTDKFTALAGFEKTLHMHIVQGFLSADTNGDAVDDGDGMLGVFLVDNTGTEEVCINLELIRQGEADLNTSLGKERTAVPDDMDALEMLDVWNPMKDDFLSKRNSYRIDVDDAGVATTGYKAQDEKRICKFFSRGQQCWRGDFCHYRHIMTDSGVSLDQEETYVTSGNQDHLVPAVGSWVALEVTTILSPERFYVIMPLGRKSLDAPSSDQEVHEDTLGSLTNCDETLDDLITALNQEYSKRPSFQGTTILKSLGEIVTARFSQDQQWYRARIIEVTEDKVKVFYVDFGNTEWLPEDEVAEIKPEFLHLPFQALECFLYNVEPAGQEEAWSEEARSYFRELVDGKTLVGLVRSSSCNNSLTVELFDTSTEEDVNIGDMLVEKGCATRSSVNRETSGNISELGSSCRSSISTGSVNFIPG